MACLKGSQNYVWSTTSVLGKGATGAVYQGVNKTNGEPVAVKTFNQYSHLRPREVKLREFEVLQKVKHENIVKLLGIEEEEGGGSKVIVMELCTGGSLFNILDDPENTYGLEEKEFLLVLEHLTAGMKHLRDNNLVHRDLKPGNIMKFICDDGTTIYKLTDFGAARELQDGEEFKSLYGTEEYLHPDMYVRAVLRKPINKTFSATIDLWSIGVTIYHVATGNLPFRPYGGRRNKDTMYYITTKKETGVISGIQTSDNGPIEWQKELPNSCQLSVGLKKIVTPLLAGLLEADTSRIWTFERFFSEVTAALARQPVNIFHINKAQLLKVYIHPDEVFTNLQYYIFEQTSVKEENQILIFDNTLYNNFFDDSTRACGYPITTEEKPVFLFSNENNNVLLDQKIELPSFSKFPENVHLENDAAQAKLACSIGHMCKRLTEKHSLASELIAKSVRNFSQYINMELNDLNCKSQHLLEKTAIYKKSIQVFQLSQHIASYILSNFKPDSTDKLKLISDPFVVESATKVQQLYQRYAVENTLKLEWDTSIRSLKCPAKSKAPARSKTLVENLRDSWQHLVRDRATRTLSFNDEQFHILEGIKIIQTLARVKTLFEKEVFIQFSQLVDTLSDWYKISQTVYLQTMILKKDVKAYEVELKDFEEDFTIENMQYTEYVKNNMPHSKNLTNGQVKHIQNKNLKALIRNKDAISNDLTELLMENTSIMTQISELCRPSSEDVESNKSK